MNWFTDLFKSKKKKEELRKAEEAQRHANAREVYRANMAARFGTPSQTQSNLKSSESSSGIGYPSYPSYPYPPVHTMMTPSYSRDDDDSCSRRSSVTRESDYNMCSGTSSSDNSSYSSSDSSSSDTGSSSCD